MKRLTTDTLNTFVRDADIAVLMFGAQLGEATMEQAVEFADAWAEHRDQAEFGYVDAFENVAAARALSIRVLPTTLVLQYGEIIASLEGRCASHRITAAVCAANTMRAAAA